VPLKTFVKMDTVPVQPLSISHQSQFPAVTISFNLAQGAALGDAVTAINAAMADMRTPLSLQGSFQGTAQAFQASLSSQPYLIAAALVTVYIILGILYESYILPLTILSTLPSAGVGALLMLMIAGPRPVGDRDDRHDPADRHREEERHHDGGLRHHAGAKPTAWRRTTRSGRPACCASGRS
jgi:multidrug efflux pump subunit AcrB